VGVLVIVGVLVGVPVSSGAEPLLPGALGALLRSEATMAPPGSEAGDALAAAPPIADIANQVISASMSMIMPSHGAILSFLMLPLPLVSETPSTPGAISFQGTRQI
jgi:hypothetical protein